MTFLRSLMRSKAGFVGFVVFALMVLFALVGPLFTPGYLPTDLNAVYLPPSLSHPLGTDSEGRDIAIQMINGGWSVILVGVVAAAISTFVAIVFGSLAAYLGRWVDSVIVTVTDIVLTIPQIVLLAVLASLYKLDSPWLLAVIIGAFSWPYLLRSVRAQVFSLKEREYVEAAQLLDLGTPRIVAREILPNMATFIMMNFVITMTNAIYALVGLYFLGLAPIVDDNWGAMLNKAWTRGAIFFSDSIFYVLAPVIAISILQLSLVTMTRSFEEILNPRLRES
ncbi:ABC transporter permease [Phytohabitans rumicis]|uniref:Peptide ABC transporter permease n=1 Tax=Phytohabitans rumicis TaxID=1076125 RepID=A0A6V8L7X6_9ACTN|nr:ABC transporter permease [Phytohabitans rumicis]GFJ91650.1 peptide ABC transporter permease [Phytohabitans rumicis]